MRSVNKSRLKQNLWIFDFFEQELPFKRIYLSMDGSVDRVQRKTFQDYNNRSERIKETRNNNGVVAMRNGSVKSFGFDSNNLPSHS